MSSLLKYYCCETHWVMILCLGVSQLAILCNRYCLSLLGLHMLHPRIISWVLTRTSALWYSTVQTLNPGNLFFTKCTHYFNIGKYCVCSKMQLFIKQTLMLLIYSCLKISDIYCSTNTSHHPCLCCYLFIGHTYQCKISSLSPHNI